MKKIVLMVAIVFAHQLVGMDQGSKNSRPSRVIIDREAPNPLDRFKGIGLDKNNRGGRALIAEVEKSHKIRFLSALVKHHLAKNSTENSVCKAPSGVSFKDDAELQERLIDVLHANNFKLYNEVQYPNGDLSFCMQLVSSHKQPGVYVEVVHLKPEDYSRYQNMFKK